MRKITQQSVAAFLSGGNFKSGNMQVITNGDMFSGETSVMKLHGNTIAKRENGELWISNGGWSSNTTKERLNALPGVRVNQKNFEWYLNDQSWDGSWIKV